MIVLLYFSDAETRSSSYLGVIQYSEVFEVILNCLQYVSFTRPFLTFVSHCFYFFLCHKIQCIYLV